MYGGPHLAALPNALRFAAASALAPQIQTLASRFKLSRTVATWLAHRGHADLTLTERFLTPKLAHLSSPDAMADRACVSARIAAAIRGRERIVVFGDYDCDGITSAAILTEAIRALKGDAVPLVASRFDGGYGVSPSAVRRILATGARLLVTCDCGSSDHVGLREIMAAGVDVVVIDHHLVPAEPLPALGFLNPHRPECGFGYKHLTSCGLALSIVAALRKELGVDLDVRYWLDLVAIGTIADVAPLDGDNRSLVRAGLEAIRKAERPGMKALLALAKIKGESPLTARDVSFRIAPHINAPGRLGAADLALELLLAKDAAEAERIAQQIEQISTQRRSLSDEMVTQACEEIERRGLAAQPAIVVGRPGWNHGVVGIVAARLTELYERPVIVVGFEGDVGRGSVRGPRGSRLHDALCRVSDVLVRFGGHQAAAGCELKLANLDLLQQRFAEAVDGQGPVAKIEPGENLLALDGDDEPQRVLADLDRLEPCGMDNPRPRLLVEARVDAARELKGSHLKLYLTLPSKRVLECFGPNLGQYASTLTGNVALEGDLRHNTYPGSPPAELLIEKVWALEAPVVVSEGRVAAQPTSVSIGEARS
jgi:single-stranded-DNA-specific exonuclease